MKIKIKDKFTPGMSLWQPWFAWRPVRVGHGDARWLETVFRRAIGTKHNYSYMYRSKESMPVRRGVATKQLVKQ